MTDSPFLSGFSGLSSPVGGDGINPMLLALLAQNGTEPFSFAPSIPAVQKAATGVVSPPIPGVRQPQNSNSSGSMGDILGLAKLLGGAGGSKGNSGGGLLDNSSLFNWSGSNRVLGGNGPLFGNGGYLDTLWNGPLYNPQSTDEAMSLIYGSGNGTGLGGLLSAGGAVDASAPLIDAGTMLPALDAGATLGLDSGLVAGGADIADLLPLLFA